MVAENLYINGVDISAQYGMVLLQDSYKDLVQYPSLKKIETISWAERNGIDVDLCSPKLDTKGITLKFAIHDRNSTLVDDFMCFLSGSYTLIEGKPNYSYHKFEFRELGQSYILRVEEQGGLKLYDNLGFFDLKLVDDFPQRDYIYSPPKDSTNLSQGYELTYDYILENELYTETNDLADYGVMILDGTLDSIRKMPKIKHNLLRNIDTMSGALYDGGAAVRYEAKDVQLHCFMRTASVGEFCHNYNALLHDLTRPNPRTLYVDSTGDEYPCYYKSGGVVEFEIIRGEVWCKFDVTLCFTAFTIGESTFILATERKGDVVTEDGLLIDLK